jgi:hypothetical protein
MALKADCSPLREPMPFARARPSWPSTIASKRVSFAKLSNATAEAPEADCAGRRLKWTKTNSTCPYANF